MATKVKEEMRFDERITIHSLADWVVGFNKKIRWVMFCLIRTVQFA